MSDIASFVIKSDLKLINDAIAFVDAQCFKHGITGKDKAVIDVALDELLNNTIRHGYSDKKGIIGISSEINGDTITLVIEDYAKPFNPLEMPDPDLSTSLENKKEGGLGVFIVKKVMDQVRYFYDEQKKTNNIVLEKKFGKK